MALAATLVTAVLIGGLATPAQASEPALSTITDPPPFGCVESNANPSLNRFSVCTNDATGETVDDSIIVDELTRLVERTAGPGDSIRISMFQWWYRKDTTPTFDYSHIHDLTHAVIDAYVERDVDVEVLIDNVSDPAWNSEIDLPGLAQPFDELTAALGSRVTVCHRDGPGTYPSDCLDAGNDNAINHNKFFLFEIDGDVHTVITSANLVPAVQLSYNNLLHVRWDQPLYDFFLDYWNRIKANSWSGWTTGADREALGGVVPATGLIHTKGYVFPRTTYEDPFLAVLNRVTACPDPYNRKIWISMSAVSAERLNANGNALRDRLTALTNMGCAVKFVVDDAVDSTARAIITNTGATLVVANSLHHKFLIVDATATGPDGEPAAPREFVWTGAMNLSWSSAWRDGESAIVVDDNERVVRSFASHFTCIWNRNRIDGGDDDDSC
jgi:phosphatidylserine/phosphatidylglycerophosphate/cardiolipin synthase-like enzyme